jgi:hypothetical protein
MNKNKGIKVFQQTRQTDIFNTKSNTERTQVVDKKKIIEISEKLIDNKIRDISPYIQGSKNIEYIPLHLKSNVNIGDTVKMNKTLNDYKDKMIQEHMDRDITPPKKEEAKYYGKKVVKGEATNSVKEALTSRKPENKSLLSKKSITTKITDNKLDISNVSKTPPRNNITNKITDLDNSLVRTPVKKNVTNKITERSLTPVLYSKPNRGAQNLNKTDLSIDNSTIHVI